MTHSSPTIATALVRVHTSSMPQWSRQQVRLSEVDQLQTYSVAMFYSQPSSRTLMSLEHILHTRIRRQLQTLITSSLVHHLPIPQISLKSNTSCEVRRQAAKQKCSLHKFLHWKTCKCLEINSLQCRLFLICKSNKSNKSCFYRYSHYVCFLILSLSIWLWGPTIVRCAFYAS